MKIVEMFSSVIGFQLTIVGLCLGPGERKLSHRVQGEGGPRLPYTLEILSTAIKLEGLNVHVDTAEFQCRPCSA